MPTYSLSSGLRVGRELHVALAYCLLRGNSIAVQNDLLTRIGGMLSQFASRKADAVSQAIHQFSQHNHGAAKEVGARSQQLHDLALSAQQSLKVCLLELHLSSST